jgi:hypothetical protein
VVAVEEARMEDEDASSDFSVDVLLLAPVVLGAEDAEVLVAVVEEPDEAELLALLEDEPSLLILMLCQLPDLSPYS